MKKLISVIVVLLVFFVVAILPQTNIIVPQMVTRHDFTFGGNRDNIRSVLLQDNSYIVSGRKYWTGLWQYAYICKMSPNGDVLWELTHSDSTYAGANSLAKAPNGDIFWSILVPGNVNKPSTIYRISPQGNIVWEKAIDKIPSDGVINAIASDNDYLVIAQGNNQTRKIMIFDHDGNLLFEPWYLSLEFITGLIVKDNYLYISGDKPGGIVINYQSEMYKTDFSGNIVWSDTIQDMINPRIVFIDDNVYLTGRYFAFAQGDQRIWMRTIKYDEETGQIIWQKYHNGDIVPIPGQHINCDPVSITVHPEGGVVVVGYSNKFGVVDLNSTDAVAISYDSQGEERFKIRYDYESNWFATSFSFALFDGNTLVSFGSAKEEDLPPNNNAQLYFAKWNNVTGVEPEPGIIPNDYILYQNYPNPFNPITTIKFSTPHSGNVLLKVFNLLGQEIETLVDEYLPSGTYNVQFAGQNLPSGIYIYELRTENFTTTKKMVVIK